MIHVLLVGTLRTVARARPRSRRGGPPSEALPRSELRGFPPARGQPAEGIPPGSLGCPRVRLGVAQARWDRRGQEDETRARGLPPAFPRERGLRGVEETISMAPEAAVALKGSSRSAGPPRRRRCRGSSASDVVLVVDESTSSGWTTARTAGCRRMGRCSCSDGSRGRRSRRTGT